MKKLKKVTYRGIEYIRLSSLPAQQAEALRAVLTPRTLIKINRDGIILTDCVLYSAYEAWWAEQEKQKAGSVATEPALGNQQVRLA